MERELRDCYDNQSNPTGETYFKGDKLPEGRYAMQVIVSIQNSKGEFLMQKRVPRKGGNWGVTGGHPKSGETPIQGAITEVKEELSLDITADQLTVFSEGFDGKVCYKMYYLNMDFDTDALDIQKEELSEAKWFSIQTLQGMVDSGEMDENQIACFLKCMKFLEKKAQK